MTNGSAMPPKAPRAKRPTIKNADVPSETLGLPEVGTEASSSHFARDTTQWQNAEEDEKSGSSSQG